MNSRRAVWASLAAVLACLLLPLSVAAGSADTLVPAVADQASILLHLLTWLLPLGVTLVAVGLSDASRAHQAATALPLALALALGSYFLCGFAFQFGGVGLVSGDPGLAAFIAEWSPLDLRLGPGWGLVGLRGFALPSQALTEPALTLFLSQLAPVTTATLIPLLALNERRPRLPTLFLALLVACVAYPLVGNWLRGGGWLSQLGATLRLGHGYVDYGFSSLHLLGGLAALAGLVAFKHRGVRPPLTGIPELPPGYLPLNALAGAFLAFLGWLAMIFSQPLVSLSPSPSLVILKTLLAVASSILTTLFYGWLVRGTLDAGLTGRGILAALVAVGAGLPFLPPWAIVLVAGSCGLLLAPVIYLVEQVFRLDDRGAVVSVHGFAALWGMLAVGLFADGKQGLGWNGSALATVRAVTQGVIGYLSPAGGRDPAQLYAQLIGVGAILVLAALLPWAILTLTAQAYALPPQVRERAHRRALQLQQEREAREQLKRQGGLLTLGQRLSMAYLQRVAGSPRRLSRRARLPRPKPSAAHLTYRRLRRNM